VRLATRNTALVASFFSIDIDKYMTNFVNETAAGKAMRASHEHYYYEKRARPVGREGVT
jgi:hypothetical protein